MLNFFKRIGNGILSGFKSIGRGIKNTWNGFLNIFRDPVKQETKQASKSALKSANKIHLTPRSGSKAREDLRRDLLTKQGSRTEISRLQEDLKKSRDGHSADSPRRKKLDDVAYRLQGELTQATDDYETTEADLTIIEKRMRYTELNQKKKPSKAEKQEKKALREELELYAINRTYEETRPKIERLHQDAKEQGKDKLAGRLGSMLDAMDVIAQADQYRQLFNGYLTTDKKAYDLAPDKLNITKTIPVEIIQHIFIKLYSTKKPEKILPKAQKIEAQLHEAYTLINERQQILAAIESKISEYIKAYEENKEQAKNPDEEKKSVVSLVQQYHGRLAKIQQTLKQNAKKSRRKANPFLTYIPQTKTLEAMQTRLTVIAETHGMPNPAQDASHDLFYPITKTLLMLFNGESPRSTHIDLKALDLRGNTDLPKGSIVPPLDRSASTPSLGRAATSAG